MSNDIAMVAAVVSAIISLIGAATSVWFSYRSRLAVIPNVSASLHVSYMGYRDMHPNPVPANLTHVAFIYFGITNNNLETRVIDVQGTVSIVISKTKFSKQTSVLNLQPHGFIEVGEKVNLYPEHDLNWSLEKYLSEAGYEPVSLYDLQTKKLRTPISVLFEYRLRYTPAVEGYGHRTKKYRYRFILPETLDEHEPGRFTITWQHTMIK